MTSDYQRGASEMRERAAKLADEKEKVAARIEIELKSELTNASRRAFSECAAAIRALPLPLPTDPASNEGADETEPPKIITPGNALWAFGLAEEEVKRLRAENAELRGALEAAEKWIASLEKITGPCGCSGFCEQYPETEAVYYGRLCRDARIQQTAALANRASVQGMDAPNHIMCIGWETIKRLAAGKAVWIESIQAGAVAADDLLGVDINALLAALASPDKPEGGK